MSAHPLEMQTVTDQLFAKIGQPREVGGPTKMQIFPWGEQSGDGHYHKVKSFSNRKHHFPPTFVWFSTLQVATSTHNF